MQVIRFALMTIESRIEQARGGDLIVGNHPCQNGSLEAAARRFGLFFEPGNYFEISPEESAAVLVAVLAEDMAYRCELMPRHQAAQLAAEFISQSSNEAAKY